MANIEKTIEIIFGATDNTGSAISSVSKNVSGAITNISGVTKPLADLTDSLVSLEIGIVASGAALVGFSINEAGQFQTSIGEIGALFNATSDQSKKLGNDILSFAKDSVFSINDINKATFTAISTGTKWTEVTDTLAISQKLAVAGSADLSTATAALTRTLNAYGFEASEAERVSNALFVAAQLGDTNLTELGNNFGNLAATASASNVSLEESLAAVSALTVSGIKTAEVMTQLKALFRELSSPSKKLAVALGGTTIKADGLQAVLKKITEVTGGTQAGTDKLFGSVEAVSAALILGKDSTGAFNNSLLKLADSSGKVETAYSKLVDNFTNLNQNLANNVRAALISAGEDLLDEYGGITKALSNIFSILGMDVSKGGLNSVISAIESFGSEASTLLDGIAAALPKALNDVDYSGVISSFQKLFGEISKITGGIDLTDSGQLTDSIQFVIDSLSSLTRFITGVVQAWNPVIDQIFNAVNAFNKLSDKEKETAGNIGGISQVFEKFKGFLLAGTAALETFASAINVIAGSLVVGVLGGISKELEATAISSALGSTSISKFISLLGKGGLLGAAGAAGFALGDLIGAKDGVDSLVQKFTGVEGQTLGGAIFDLLHSGDNATTGGAIKDIGVTISSTADSAGKSVKVVDGAVRSLKDYDAIVAEVAAKSITATDQTNSFSEGMKKLGFAVDPVTGAISKIKKAIDETADSQDRARDTARGYTLDLEKGVPTYTQVGNGLKKVSKALETTKEKTSQLTKEQELAINNTAKFEETLAQLASNERIAAFEFTAEIKVAEIEADAKKVTAAFDTIASSIQSANDLTSSLFSQLSDPNLSGFDKFTLESGIRKAEKQAAEQLQLQKILTKAQTDNLNARTKILQNGGSTINVLADNLAPELQQVLKSLINNIRVQAINEGLEILT